MLQCVLYMNRCCRSKTKRTSYIQDNQFLAIRFYSRSYKHQSQGHNHPTLCKKRCIVVGIQARNTQSRTLWRKIGFGIDSLFGILSRYRQYFKCLARGFMISNRKSQRRENKNFICFTCNTSASCKSRLTSIHARPVGVETRFWVKTVSTMQGAIRSKHIIGTCLWKECKCILSCQTV